VKNRFQSLPFKCNLQRYMKEAHLAALIARTFIARTIGGAVQVESSCPIA
jgi:hypothetical protein